MGPSQRRSNAALHCNGQLWREVRQAVAGQCDAAGFFSMTSTYTQCKLQRGAAQQTAWIPTRYAERGKIIEIGARTNKLTAKTWKILSCGTVMDAEYVEAYERRSRTEPQASDI